MQVVSCYGLNMQHVRRLMKVQQAGRLSVPFCKSEHSASACRKYAIRRLCIVYKSRLHHILTSVQRLEVSNAAVEPGYLRAMLYVRDTDVLNRGTNVRDRTTVRNMFLSCNMSRGLFERSCSDSAKHRHPPLMSL